DDQAFGLHGYAQLPAPRHPRAAFRGGNPVHARAGFVAPAEPAHAGTLGIVIHEGGPEAGNRMPCREVGRDGALSASPLGVQYDDLSHDIFVKNVAPRTKSIAYSGSYSSSHKYCLKYVT